MDVKFDPTKDFAEVHSHPEFHYKQGGVYFDIDFKPVGEDESQTRIGKGTQTKKVNRQHEMQEHLRRAAESDMLGDLGAVSIGAPPAVDPEVARENMAARQAEETHG